MHLAGAADFNVTLFPPWFAPTQSDWPGPIVEGDFALHDPHETADAAPALSPALQDFLARGDAPLVFTPGSANFHAARLLRLALAAVQRLGQRAVFLTPQRSQVPDPLPPQVMWLPYVPLGALLPHAALLLHHGGIGTAAQALRAGVPQMVVPHGWDQFDNAVRLRRLGVARSCPAYRLTGFALRRHLGALLGDAGVRQACQAAAARMTGSGATSLPRLADLPARIEAQAATSA
ncbi:MAG: glycosyltransferase [Burkholderiaceae bacterium]